MRMTTVSRTERASRTGQARDADALPLPHRSHRTRTALDQGLIEDIEKRHTRRASRDQRDQLSRRRLVIGPKAHVLTSS